MIELIEGLERHIYLGETREEGDQVVIVDALIVRYWHAKEVKGVIGIGRYVLHGRSGEDRIDQTGTVRLYRAAIVARTECPLKLEQYK